MTHCTLEIQGKKIKVGDDDANHGNLEPAVCRDFWNEAPEDVLTEIFIRHPDCRSAARAIMVCRRWHSLILRNPHFVQRFKSRHHHEIFPWTIMFGTRSSYKPFQTHCQIYSEECMFLHGSPANCLDFLPSPMMIRAASYSDLLLVSPGLSRTDDLYVCNPVTKQFAQLPPIPKLKDTRFYERKLTQYALVPMPPSGATTNSRFKVVELLPYYSSVSTDRPVFLFCSESGKWEIRNLPGLGRSDFWGYTISSEIITCNGILYWLGTSDHSKRLAYFDLSEEKCGEIDIPSGDKGFARRIGMVHAVGGVHELRLIQVFLMHKPKIIYLRVWRLNTNKNRNNNNNDEDEDADSNWFLVHDKMLERPKNLSEENHPFRGTFVHPTDGDFLFIVYGKSVIGYNLSNATHKKTAELIELDYWSDVTPFVMVLPSTASNLANSYL